MNSKLIGGLLILVLLVGLGFGLYKHKNPEVFKTSSDTTLVADGPDKSKGGSVATIAEAKQANIEISNPVGGSYKGVIEVGASGFNSFIVLIDKEKNWELVSKEFGESLAYEGFATTDDVKLGLKKYLATMFAKGVNGRNAHFVMSSGALKNKKTELIAKAIESMGYVVNRVTAEQEGKYALKALLPKAYKDKGFVVDIGSGNTKVSWYEGSKLNSLEGPGAKYFQIPMSDPAAYDKIKEIVSKVPADLRKNVFLIGGVPFQLAKEVKNGDNRFTSLPAPDEFSAGDDVKKKSGLNIYRAIYDTTNADQYIFDWDANFTIGFLLSLN